MTALKQGFLAFFGLSSGFAISGAVFAFISALNVIPRMAQKTKTRKQIMFYEECVTIGGTFGAVLGFVKIYAPVGKFLAASAAGAIGVFYGCVAVSLAEIINVLPILARRTKIAKGMFWLILCIALGKMFGGALYFFLPGYYH